MHSPVVVYNVEIQFGNYTKHLVYLVHYLMYSCSLLLGPSACIQGVRIMRIIIYIEAPCMHVLSLRRRLRLG